MLLAQKSQFTFEVDSKSTKQSIKQSVESNFKVQVLDIKTGVLKGKTRRFGKKRMPSKLSDSKKAIVTLKKGQKIDYFDIVDEKKK